jgi:sec-independent protein translocase protein TatB
MFDVSFGELLLCFIVALIVLGPQKLPAVARTLGYWTGRARVYVRNLNDELERETQGSGLKDLRDAAHEARDEVQRLGKPGPDGR